MDGALQGVFSKLVANRNMKKWYYSKTSWDTASWDTDLDGTLF